MNTNITTENYEAYLLDYMEGNLSPKRAEELKAFVAAQGLDWDELTTPLPYLEAPQIAYEDKEKLKKKAAVVPLYVKIASAAAAAGLLLTVSLWPEKQLPKLEPIADLKPMEAICIDTKEPTALLPRRITECIDPLPRTSQCRDDMLSEASNKGQVVSERESATLLAELPTKAIAALPSDVPLTTFDEPDFDLLAYRMNLNLAIAQMKENDFEEEAYDDHELSWFGKAIFSLTKGRHNSFASLINFGLGKAKQDLTEAATDLALTAYSNINEQIEETKERRNEKHGE